QLFSATQYAMADGTDPLFEVDPFVAGPVALALARKGLAAAMGAFEDFAGVFLRTPAAISPARVDAFGSIQLGCRPYSAAVPWLGASHADLLLYPGHDLFLASSCKNPHTLRFLLRSGFCAIHRSNHGCALWA